MKKLFHCEELRRSITLCVLLGINFSSNFASAQSPKEVAHDKVAHRKVEGCVIKEIDQPHATDATMATGTWVNVGSIYHAGSLSIRVNAFDVEKRIYSVDIKSPDYSGDGWSISPNGGPATIKTCGKDVSVAIISYANQYALTVGVF